MKTLVVQGLGETIINPLRLKHFGMPKIAYGDFKTLNGSRKLMAGIIGYFLTNAMIDFRPRVSGYGNNTLITGEGNNHLMESILFNFKLMDGWKHYDWVFWIDLTSYDFWKIPMPFSSS